ncbi:general RNA polymerase II transcription factor [Scheffersomyces xylosifermentans]|uniref:general RNA polymerase II transcription factor n=1 Tax=Scheffersomyces xylosifermentans TaxID=1304137 RepID=UPI00315CC980
MSTPDANEVGSIDPPVDNVVPDVKEDEEPTTGDFDVEDEEEDEVDDDNNELEEENDQNINGKPDEDVDMDAQIDDNSEAPQTTEEVETSTIPQDAPQEPTENEDEFDIPTEQSEQNIDEPTKLEQQPFEEQPDVATNQAAEESEGVEEADDAENKDQTEALNDDFDMDIFNSEANNDDEEYNEDEADRTGADDLLETELNTVTATKTDDLEEDEILSSDDESAQKKSYTKQTHLIIVPSYASWFNMRKVHRIEQESLPEFFSSNHPSKSPKIYVNYRNFMINSYRLNPNEFLTLTSCRRNLVGDVGTLMRVHRFLSKWGLINYQVKPQFKPGYAAEKLPNGQSVGLPFTGDYHVKYDTPRGLFPFDTYKVQSEHISAANAAKLRKLLNLEPTTTGPVVGEANGEGNHIINVNSDSIKTKRSSTEESTQATKRHNDGWSPEETKALVTAVKTYRNDWFKIADEVGPKKTPQQCILKFLQIPIEDSFNPIDSDDAKLLKFAPNYPISSIDNPVLSNLAFMTRLVDSDVAKAASERASRVIDEKIAEKVVEGEKIEEAKLKSEGEKTDGAKDSEGSDKKNAPGVAETAQSNKPDTDHGPEQNGKVSHLEGDSSSQPLSSKEILKGAAEATFGIAGARSHLFATYEEREMNSISNSIVNHQLAKIDLKLHKVDELERIYERERKHLAKQQEEIFIDRLALAKSTINITRKLDDVIALMEDSVKSENTQDKVSSISSLLAEAKSLLFKPARHSLIPVVGETTTNGELPEQRAETSVAAAASSAVDEENFKPLSLKTPKSFKVWVP